MSHTIDTKGEVRPKVTLQQYPSDLDPWEYSGIEFMGPLTVTEKGHQYLIIFVNFLSRYVELVPTVIQTAVEVAEALKGRGHYTILRYSTLRVLICNNAHMQ